MFPSIPCRPLHSYEPFYMLGKGPDCEGVSASLPKESLGNTAPLGDVCALREHLINTFISKELEEN